MEKAHEALQKEVDIIKLIQSRRFMHMALKHLLDPTLHKEFKTRSQLQKIHLEENGVASRKDANEKMSRTNE